MKTKRIKILEKEESFLCELRLATIFLLETFVNSVIGLRIRLVLHSRTLLRKNETNEPLTTTHAGSDRSKYREAPNI